jgi:deoxyribonuclease-1-like protein
MPRSGVLILALMAAIGAWFVTSQGGPGALTRGVHRQTASAPESSPHGTATDTYAIRIASFDLNGFGAEELKQPETMDIAVRIIRKFDLIALQRITSPEAFILPGLVDQINQQGPHYDFVVGPRTGDAGKQQQLAILFNSDRLEIDRLRLYSVADPDDLILNEPLVASFRCREVAPREAFTFSLVNILIDESETDVERNFLPQIYQAVTQDGRREDDIVMAGNFQANAQMLTELLGGTSMRTVVVELPTGLGTDEQTDNIVLSLAATTEFTGRAGVLDFLREFNLSLEQARKLTDHLPVWAEFTLQEGGLPGRVADRRLKSGSLSSSSPR